MTNNQRERYRRIDELRAAKARREPPPLTQAEKLGIICIIVGLVGLVLVLLRVNWLGGL